MKTATGVIDWPTNSRSTWVNTQEGGTWVYAFWLADHSRPPAEVGVSLFKPSPDYYPDPFLLHPEAENVILPVRDLEFVISPNGLYDPEDDTEHIGRPIIAAVCLGTSTDTYSSIKHEKYWWCSMDDLTRQGRKTVNAVTKLLGRPPILITYLAVLPMYEAAPETAVDQATVAAVSG